MMKLTLRFILLIYLLNFFNVSAQKRKKDNLKFEQKIEDFRYSLFQDLEKVDIAKLFRNYDPNNFLIKKADAFIAENKSQIKEYQKYKLNKYFETIIDLSSFEPDTCFNSDGVEKILVERIQDLNEGIEKGGSLGKLMMIHPFDHAVRIIFNYEIIYYREIQHLSESEIGIIREKSRIAKEKIKTKIESEDVWKIWFDYYFTLYEFSYNFDSNKMELLEVYRRR